MTDHLQQSQWIIATGFGPDGSWSASACQAQIDDWKHTLEKGHGVERTCQVKPRGLSLAELGFLSPERTLPPIRANCSKIHSTRRHLSIESRQGFERSQAGPALELYRRIQQVSPAPHGGFSQKDTINSSAVHRNPFSNWMEGTFAPDLSREHDQEDMTAQSDATLAFQLQSSEKERAELLMITDLLRNDLERCANLEV